MPIGGASMSFDGIFTRAMVSELNRELENGRIGKVHQPFQHEIILTVRANRKNKRVLLSFNTFGAAINKNNKTKSGGNAYFRYFLFSFKLIALENGTSLIASVF